MSKDTIKKIIELAILGLWLFIAIIIFVHYSTNFGKPMPLPNELVVPKIPDSEKGKKLYVSRVVVLSGDSFDLTIRDKDNSRVLCKLFVLATDNSKEKVVDLLNHSTNPRVILREKQADGHWKVDFFLFNDGKEINLVDWLSANNLIYKN